MEAWDNVVARTISDANSPTQSQKSRTTLVHDSMRNSPQVQTTRQTQKLAAGPDGGAAVEPPSIPDGCDPYGDGNNPNCWVQSQPWTDTVDASVGGPSQNLVNFRLAVAAARKILEGKNPCADFYKGAGLKGLDAISSAVESQGNKAFSDLGAGHGGTGIKMGVPTATSAGGFDAPGTDSDGNQLYGSVAPTSVIINSAGAFVAKIPRSNLSTDKLGKFGNYPPASLQSRVVQLLHEIGHLTITGTQVVTTVIKVGKGKHQEKRPYQQFEPDPLLKLDGRDSSLSEENTKKVLGACGDQVKALGP